MSVSPRHRHSHQAISLFLVTPALTAALGLALAGSGLPALAATAAPSDLEYARTLITGTVGVAISSDTPVTKGGTVKTYTISPALPAGLTLNATTGVISGTPTVAVTSLYCQVDAANSAGDTTEHLTITINPIAPSALTYPQTSIAAKVGVAISADTPTVKGTAPAFTVAPALPAGLSLNASTGAITGTPTAAAASAAYTVTATNKAGSTSAKVTIAVASSVLAPTGLSYPLATIAGTVGQAIVPDTPTLTDSVSATFTVAPALPGGLALNAATGVISGTPTAVAAAATYTVTATDAAGSSSAALVISAQAASSGGIAGFMGLFDTFPGTAAYASTETAAAMAANPWMKGARFHLNNEAICQDTSLPIADWNGDAANVSGFTNPLSQVMIRMNADPDATWNIQSASTAAYTDSVVAGVVAVGTAAHTTNYLLDPENYDTNYMLSNYNQTTSGDPILNSPAISRAAMCAQMRAFGKAYGTSLWSRVPNATLYTFFGPTMVLPYTNGGTGIPTSCPDSAYAKNAKYNMLPYFFLGLLDACPSTGHIADYCEGSYYDFTGLASIKRNMTASKNWVSIFFPTESADIAKSATCWVPLPLIYVNAYFQAAEGPAFPGAYYVTNPTDQVNYFTRNLYYCLQQTPAGYMPGLYVEGFAPWAAAPSNMPAAWQTCVANALAVYQGQTTLANLFNATTLDTDLAKDFASDPGWAAECQ